MSEQALQQPAFRLLLVYRLALTLAIQIQSVGVAWHVYELTKNPLYLGYVGLAIFLPTMLSALPAGRLSDTYPRLRLMRIAVGILILCSLSLQLSVHWHGGGLWHLYGTFILIGVARSLGNPSTSSYLPQLIKGPALPQAVALSSTTFQLGTIVGPALAGLLFAWKGMSLVYGVSLTLYLAVMITSLFLPSLPAPEQHSRQLDLWGGLKYIWQQKLVLGAVSLDLFAVLLGGAVALLPIFAREILHVGPEGLGFMRAAPAVGAALMALTLAYRPIRRQVGAKMLLAVACFGLATLAFGLSTNFYFSLACLVILGATDMISVVVRQTLIQVHTPDSMRGRVAAVNMVFIGASNELGEFESGVTAALWGTVPAVVIGGVGTLVVVALWAWLFPKLRKVNSYSEAAA